MYLFLLLLEQQLLLNFSLCFSAIAFAAFKLQVFERTLWQSTFTLFTEASCFTVCYCSVFTVMQCEQTEGNIGCTKIGM